MKKIISEILTLEASQKNLNSLLGQIRTQILSRMCLSESRFYATLSYEGRGLDYRNHFNSLLQGPNPTAQELEQLIIGELNCSYNFTCWGPGHDFGDRYPPRSSKSDLLHIYHYEIINFYIVEKDYQKCLEAILQDPDLLTYGYVPQLYLKCLLWCGYIKECRQKITREHPPEKINKVEMRIFYFLQRALCAWHLGALAPALQDCDAAWASAYNCKQIIPQAQRPAILWLRAQVNRALGANRAAVNDLRQLITENYTTPKKYIRPLRLTGINRLQRYIRHIERENK